MAGCLPLRDDKRHIWIPRGFAHGLLATTDAAECLYKTTDYWYPEHECSLLWSDPDVGVRWPLEGQPKIAKKDAAGKRFKKARAFD
jgi:dTDP-4-dehydrorhamnose 3,5-epimerase